MYWNTLKIATVLAVLVSPSAFAAIPGADAVDGRAITPETSQPLQMANHRGGDGRWSDNRRPRGGRDGDRRFDRHDRRPDFRGYPPPRYRGHPPRRHYRGRPMRRFFRYWRRHY